MRLMSCNMILGRSTLVFRTAVEGGMDVMRMAFPGEPAGITLRDPAARSA
jgi:hypothetical protein